MRLVVNDPIFPNFCHVHRRFKISKVSRFSIFGFGGFRKRIQRASGNYSTTEKTVAKSQQEKWSRLHANVETNPTQSRTERPAESRRRDEGSPGGRALMTAMGQRLQSATRTATFHAGALAARLHRRFDIRCLSLRCNSLPTADRKC